MKKLALAFIIILSIVIVMTQANATDEELFSANVSPDALIILDMSGSMNLDPAGKPPASDSDMKIEISRNVIKDLLDDNNDGTIDTVDEQGLNVRLGYMRFRDISTAPDKISLWNDGDPFVGNIKVFQQEGDKPSTEIGSPYSNIWKRVSDAAETATGATPLAAALAEAKKYFLEDVNPSDNAIACRKKFIVLVTDGSDTVACGGDGSEGQADMWKRRMLTVQRAKEAYEAGIQVYAVGFGTTMPDYLKKTLNWVAKYGGTFDPDPDVPKTADDYNITDYIPSGTEICSLPRDQGDPAKFNISGYAFLAKDASQLSRAMKSILGYIKQQSFAFTAPTMPSVRLIDKDAVYLSSFLPNNTPFWKGNLKAYRLNEDGSLPVDGNGKPLSSYNIWRPNTDEGAGEILERRDADSRNILVFVRGSINKFIQTNLTDNDLNLGPDTTNCNSECQKLVSYVRGIDTYDIRVQEDKNWKLGDMFHSNPVIVGEPSRFFEDEGFSGPWGFYEKNKNRTKVIIAGANDGMLHAFNTETGNEEWALIPNSLLKTLNSMKTNHAYYVDATPKVADVWFDLNNDNKKTADEWRTVLICGLRKGGYQYFALDITDTLDPQYLWEFPKSTDPATLAKVGQSWSEPAIGKVKIEQGGALVEKWVAFIGGGYDSIDEKKGTETITGNVFFVVDFRTGEIIKEFFGLDPMMRHSFPAPPTAVDTNADGYVDKVYIGDLGGQMWVFDVSFDEAKKLSDSQWKGQRLFRAPIEPQEKHNIFYQAAVAFDRQKNPWVYFGTGDRESPTDTTNPQERFYAVMDDGKPTYVDGTPKYPRLEEDLKDVTDLNTFSLDQTKKGWYIKLEKASKRLEKVLGKPTVFNKLLYFTTYYYNDKGDPCSVTGDPKLYVVEYLSGGGALVLDDYLKGKPSERSRIIGEGVPSSPVITTNMKGRVSVVIGTTVGQVYSTKVLSPTTAKEILYWREVIP
jgi:type IV pilus assembly protein PilY1